jgi:hypothetical protein
MLGHKTIPNKFRNIGIITSIASHHKSRKLEMNIKGILGKFMYMKKLNNKFINTQWVKEKKKQGKVKTL